MEGQVAADGCIPVPVLRDGAGAGVVGVVVGDVVVLRLPVRLAEA